MNHSQSVNHLNQGSRQNFQTKTNKLTPNCNKSTCKMQQNEVENANGGGQKKPFLGWKKPILGVKKAYFRG